MALLLAVTTLSASAQFEKGTKYLNTSLTNMGVSYQKNHFSLGLDAKGGYFFEDSWMVYGQFGYGFQNIKGDGNDVNTLNLGVGARYYILQNGLYMNMGAKFEHSYSGGASNNFALTPEVGYCFYLNHYVSVEPAVYYDLSLSDFSNKSKVGLKVGFGFYF